MKNVLQRLHEMPYAMLVRVARKFRLQITLDEDRARIVDQLEGIITDYLLEKSERDKEQSYVDNISKYNLMTDFEVPHEVALDLSENQQYNTISYVDMILIDNNWSYIYWNLSQYDYEKIRGTANFSSLNLYMLHNRDGFEGDRLEYDHKEVISVTLQDVDRNFYQEYHYTYCCCQLVMEYENQAPHLLAISKPVFFPHGSRVSLRSHMSIRAQEGLSLALGMDLGDQQKQELEFDSNRQGEYQRPDHGRTERYSI